MKEIKVFLCVWLFSSVLNAAYEPNIIRTWESGLAGYMYQSYDDQILNFAGCPYFYKQDTLGNPHFYFLQKVSLSSLKLRFKYPLLFYAEGVLELAKASV